ncbi:ATP synthase subunit I [Helcococcus ovis]|uniref:ATP synthase subunit I n=1 Tax=Helcococcus ovis TaxID=72026 RepID=UPI00143042A7|nr:ATP synthase subunit I [Helcococcus ovis]WNZ01071.1 ATP synthase subunit I [Helcococcus ovis]
MIENEKYVNSIIIKVLILLIVESIIILIFFDKVLPKILGLLLGGFVSIAFFKILYLNIVVAIEKSEAQAKRYMAINYSVRYLISGLIFFIAAKSIYLNIFTCLIGMLSIKFVFYINNLFSFIEERKNNSVRKDGKDEH